MLPELGDAIVDSDVNAARRSYSPAEMPPLKLVSEEITTDSGHGSSTNGVAPRVVVNNLTASWTNVS